MSRRQLQERAIRAAEAALEEGHSVSPLDVLVKMALLGPRSVDTWRQGRLETLEPLIQGSPEKLRDTYRFFVEWAEAKGLCPTEIPYVRATRNGPVALRVTLAGDPATERFFRTHYVSPQLSERKQKSVTTRLAAEARLTVFQVARNSNCSECGVEIEQGDMLHMDANQPLCLACARMDDLEFLPSGDTALTRRATKHSGRVAIVLHFSRSRGRYERQGILVEPAALARAEEECVADAPERAAARARAAGTRTAQDLIFVAEMTGRIRTLFPACPPEEAFAIAGHTAQRGSGRVGRSAAGRKLDPKALTLAVAAAIRHRHTRYDELLASGVDREDARERIRSAVQATLDRWTSAS